jgi:hypothetical protein
MDNSVINFIIFLIFTFIYFSNIRSKASLKDYSSNEGVESYYNSVNSSLLLYFGIILLTQLVTNVIVIMNMCGGSFKENLRYTSIITLIPWTLIFGIIIVIIIAFPNFKNAFSDIVGYYAVSDKVNVILTELLNHSKNVTDDVKTIVDENMVENNTKDNEVKTLNKLQNQIQAESSDLISEIFSNLSLLINKITPINFNEYWSTLRPLMKPEYASLSPEQDKYCYELLSSTSYNDYLNKTKPELPSATPVSTTPDSAKIAMIGGTTKYLNACMNKMTGGALPITYNGENGENNGSLKINNETEYSILQKYCDLKQKLLDLVIYRDNIGEALWYIYTGLLLSSIVKYNINNRGCSKSISQIQTNLNTALTQQQQENALAQAQQRVYTIS